MPAQLAAATAKTGTLDSNRMNGTWQKLGWGAVSYCSRMAAKGADGSNPVTLTRGSSRKSTAALGPWMALSACPTPLTIGAVRGTTPYLASKVAVGKSAGKR